MLVRAGLHGAAVGCISLLCGVVLHVLWPVGVGVAALVLAVCAGVCVQRVRQTGKHGDTN